MPLHLFFLVVGFLILGADQVLGIDPPTSDVDVASGASKNTGYSFNPLGVKRDPFLPPELPSQENLKDTQKFDINQMTLVAILTGIGKPQAMISLPNGKTEVISTGEVIGRRNGIVTEITPSQVKIKESFRDYQNRVKNDITTLEIAE
jgi:hypothetical protein